MRNPRLASLVCCTMAALFIGSQLSIDVSNAQEKKAETAEKTVRKKPRGRLPAYYGQVGISNKQREEIYVIQAEYREQIDKLRKQIEELETKRDAEVKGVLTEEQAKKVDDLLAAAKKRAEERRKSRSSKSTE